MKSTVWLKHIVAVFIAKANIILCHTADIGGISFLVSQCLGIGGSRTLGQYE